jgi:hypothetical protein
MELEFSQKIFEKSSYIKFHENSRSGSLVVPCGRTNGHMMKLIVPFRNFANAPKGGGYLKGESNVGRQEHECDGL